MKKTAKASFPFSEPEFRDKLQRAVEFYWASRLGQASRQKSRGVAMPVRTGK